MNTFLIPPRPLFDVHFNVCILDRRNVEENRTGDALSRGGGGGGEGIMIDGGTMRGERGKGKRNGGEEDFRS